MKFSDLLIDLNDVYGRLIPGIFLIIELYLIVNLFIPMYPEQILGYLREYPSLYILLILIFFVVSHIIGEFSLYPSFRLRGILQRETALEILKEIDVTKEKDLIKFFKSNFSEDALNSGRSLMDYCKDYLLENSFQAYLQAKKIEARINLKGGIIMPLIISGGLCLLSRQWVLSVLSFSLSVMFFDGFRRSYKGEHAFIYKAYYNCWRKHANSKTGG